MSKKLGDPLVEKAGRRGVRLRLSSAPIRVDEINRESVAAAVLDRFWQQHLREVSYYELITLTESRYRKIGMGQLMGKPTNDAAGNAWWAVRLGETLTPDQAHHLMVMTTKAPDVSYRHFCLGIRKIGSRRPNQNTVIDFRAPWDKDRKPKPKDWMNRDNSLIVQLDVVPLGDWLYTQTHFRGMDVHFRFLRFYQEQRLLLEDFAKNRNQQKYGPFRVASGNCATQGDRIFEKLVPVGEDMCPQRFFADMPSLLSKCVGRRFSQVVELTVDSQTESLGREPTRRSDYHKALNPAALPGIRRIHAAPEIN